MSRITENLRSYRTRMRMTQREVAALLNIDRTTYTSYETKREPSIDVLIKLATIFNVSVDDLVGARPPFILNEDGKDYLINTDPVETYFSSEERMTVLKLRMLTDEQRSKINEEIDQMLGE